MGYIPETFVGHAANVTTKILHTMNESNYNNSSFEGDLKSNRFKGSLYYFSIEHEEEEDHYELTVSSSSLSELDDDEDAELTEGYSYMEKSEALHDIEQAKIDFNIDFEEI